jgi:hypothetical protein
MRDQAGATFNAPGGPSVMRHAKEKARPDAPGRALKSRKDPGGQPPERAGLRRSYL